MKSSRHPPPLRVVTDNPSAKSAGAKSPFDDMEALRAQNLAAFSVLPPAPAARPAKQLARSKDFSRTWLVWLSDSRWHALFPPLVRLWLVVWYRSNEGKKPVTLTQKVMSEAGVPARHRSQYARRLEALGMVRVVGQGRVASAVEILAQPPP
jgi:hypothetical protein